MTRFGHFLGEQKGFVWTPALGFTGNCLGMLGKIKNVAKANKALHFIAGDSMHFKAVSDFWNQHGLKNKSSSGFYFINTALALCSEVHVFGFWPFNVTTDGSPAPYHYYNDLTFTKSHDMPYELRVIIAMHHFGLLRLHVGKCSEYESREHKSRKYESREHTPRDDKWRTSRKKNRISSTD